MQSRNWMSKCLVLLAMALIANQLACSKASFEATDVEPRQNGPKADNVSSPFDNVDSGDAVRCDNVSSYFCDTADDGVNPNVPPLPFDPPPVNVTQCSGDCLCNYYSNATRKSVNGVTMWLVVDSSRSFDEERLAVGRAVVNGFITSLRHRVPVTVSVIAAHAPTGPFQNFRSAAPAVNSSIFYGPSVTLNPGMTATQISSAENQLLSQLGANMQESPMSIAKQAPGNICFDGLCWPGLDGPHSGSDELGLRNFYDAMERASIPADNAWVVLFLSDENDVCVPIVENRRYVFSHPEEQEMLKYCSGINVQSVFQRVVQKAGSRPFALGALTYTGQGPIPSGVQHSVGVGYVNVVANAGSAGVMVDLAASNSFLGLQGVANNLINELASITNESVGLHSQFPIYDRSGKRLSIDQVATYNPGSGPVLDMQVFVDGRQVNYAINNYYHLVRPGVLGSQVEIRFCLK